MAEFEIYIKPKQYEPAQQVLIDLWEKHLEDINGGLNLGFVTFKNKRPNNPKNENRRIAGINAKSIAYLREDQELVKMSDEKFLYLMAKVGIDIQVKESEVRA
jgi:hypothetical protein